jgi:hypothetical protein
LQLVDRGGAEGVARRQQHALALPLQHVRRFGDAGRLARAVDPHEQVDCRGRGADHQRRRFAQPALEQLAQAGAHIVRLAQPLRPRLCAQRLQNLLHGVHIHIGGD